MNIAAPMDVIRRMPILISTMIVVGGLLGGAVVPMVQSAWDTFDRQNPVLLVRATVLQATRDEVVVQLSGEKRRDCQYIGLQAYTRAAGGTVLADAYIRRIDVPEAGTTRPIGEYANLGTWKIWPRGEAGVIAIYAQHACGGRLVISKVAELMLKG